MNIHVRALVRLLKVITIPAIAGVVIGIMFNMLTAQQLMLGLAVGIIVFMFWLFYSWTLAEIKQEDTLKALIHKE